MSPISLAGRALALVLTVAAVSAQTSRVEGPSVALAASADDGCDEGWSSSDDVRVCEVVELTGPAGPLDVSGHANGAVTVRQWDGRGVRVRAKVEAVAPDEATARALVDRTRVGIDGGRVSAETPDAEDGWVAVSFEIDTPRRTDLTVGVTNGPLRLEGLDGRIRATATNGPVSASGLAGDVALRATNGPVHITLDGRTWAGAGLDVASQNGPVSLAVPAAYGARLDARTETARVETDGLDLSGLARERGRYMGDALTATLGDGGPTLRLRSDNGPVRLRRTD